VPGTAAHVRLIGSDGTPGHARHFFAPSEFVTSTVKVLRKADGTGAFLLVPAGNALGTQLELGQYRLALTYLRNNTAAYPTSQIFREAGNADPEGVTLDIPWEMRP